MAPSVRDGQEIVPVDGVLAEGVGKGSLAARLPGLGKPQAALEELSVAIDQGHQGHWNVQEAAHELRQVIEALVGRSVQNAQIVEA